MIQTCYVPLEHPYQIIEYNGTLGIQIGTLVVTRDVSKEEDGGYAIETHSHPVVSYVNNRIRPNLKHPNSISLPRPYEGVVWDNVELFELNVLTREGESITWRDYASFCRKLRFGELEGRIKDVDLMMMDNYGMLMDWGIQILEPKKTMNGETKLSVDLADTIEINGKQYCYTTGDMGIIVEVNDELLMIADFKRQAKGFLSLLEHFQICNCKVEFWTDNLFLQAFTEKLKKHTDRLYQDDIFSEPEEEDGFGMWIAAEDDSAPIDNDDMI